MINLKCSGIYRITCTITGKFYVGSSKDIRYRWKTHVSKLNRNRSHNPILQHAWNKYGQATFVIDVLEEVPDIEQLIPKEQYYLDTLQPEFNIRKVAEKNTGIIWTAETRALMSKAKKGISPTIATEASAKANKGKPRSPEVIARIKATRLLTWERQHAEGYKPLRDDKGMFIAELPIMPDATPINVKQLRMFE